MADNIEKLQQDFDELTRRVNEQIGSGSSGTGPAAGPRTDFAPIPNPSPAPTSDQALRNGDESHSVGSWFEVAVVANDEFKESAWWFSNDTPAASQALSFIDARTNSVNHALKNTSHSQYDPAYCDWDSVRGVARLTGTKSLDAPLSGSPVGSGRTEYFGARIALRNSQSVVPTGGGIAAMLYDNAAQDFMKAGSVFHVNGERRGTVTGTTERRYRILAETDRGYSYLSDEFVDVNAPDDASFATADIYLTWDRIEGVLKYIIYRHDIIANRYRILHEVTSGANTFGDNGTILAGHDDESGYPSATHDRVICYVATLDGALSNLAVDGVNDWDDLWLNIPVPDPLASAASGNQVFRLALTVALDRKMVDAVSTATSTTVQSATAVFTALDTGRIATLYAADGVTVLHGPEAITFVDATHVTFATAVATTNVGAVLYIVGGGDHGLLVDLLHLSYQERAKFSFWPEDRNRTLQPTAAPTTTGQGGVGSGGGGAGDPGDGGIGCVTFDTPITRWLANVLTSNPYRLIGLRECLFSGNLAPNWVSKKPTTRTPNLHQVTIETGSWFYDLYFESSPGHPLVLEHLDTMGRAVEKLKAGDEVLIHVDGQMRRKKIKGVVATGRSADVGTFMLTANHLYAVGAPQFKTIIHRVIFWLLRRKLPVIGAMSRNVKRDNQIA
jgi:hypothetical protein